MLLKHSIFAPMCGSTLILVLAFGQDHPVSKAQTTTEAAVASVENTNIGRTQQSSTVNYGFLGGCYISFNERRGSELSYGCSGDTQPYSVDGDSPGLKNNSDEGLATYTSRFPVKSQSILVTPGAGALIFDPTNVTGGHAISARVSVRRRCRLQLHASSPAKGASGSLLQLSHVQCGRPVEALISLPTERNLRSYLDIASSDEPRVRPNIVGPRRKDGADRAERRSAPPKGKRRNNASLPLTGWQILRCTSNSLARSDVTMLESVTRLWVRPFASQETQHS
jgi:hypothetical protein